MANALFLPFAQLLEALQDFVASFLPQPAPLATAPVRTPVRTPQWNGPVRHVPSPAQQPKPLRVVRVVEAAAPRAVAGRMVISGRLADVCAELDRLAAQEARGQGA